VEPAHRDRHVLPFQLVNENQAIGYLLELDTVSEVTMTFRTLQQGLSYGIRWGA
jgi:hypothetical protein